MPSAEALDAYGTGGDACTRMLLAAERSRVGSGSAAGVSAGRLVPKPKEAMASAANMGETKGSEKKVKQQG